ncbi:MAG: hypothetical protein LUO95_12650 [Methylococcaceae bacterium]|nr:hypothetical protein [Methylococcaceae bacterium]MDD1611396.1 hypothetical protein [Methylococcaceae bacterium]MDD1615885.1 hypothetical protein [Methylococcaceae bacterium]OYV19153.1 MAG: hypothetical protein CG439_995 [Methylococcaceae bacterium NSP1-2]
MDITEVQKKHEDAVLELPNVIGVGIGLKDDKQVIKVFVCRKLPENLLKPDEIIPKMLDGYQTDVEDIGIVTTQSI